MKNAFSIKKLLLFIGLFSLGYFMFLIYLSYFPLKTGVGFIQFTGELITIPLVLIMLFAFGFSIFKMFKGDKVEAYLLIFSINLISILLLAYITYIQITE